MTTDNLNYSMRDSLADVDEYGDKSVDQLIAEAKREDQEEKRENYSFDLIVNKYTNANI